MKASVLLLLATVIPLGWLVLGAVVLWRFAMLHRSAMKATLASLQSIIRRRWRNYLPRWPLKAF